MANDKPQYRSGRIHKDEFVISTALMLGIIFLAVCARFAIQIKQRKKFSFDDAFILVGLGAMISAVVILNLKVIEPMYLTFALISGVPGVMPPPTILQDSVEFRKYVTVVLVLSWCTICAVKFSFMFFFKKLIDRIFALHVYWWIVLFYNIVVLGYGGAVYYLACPYFGMEPEGFLCNTSGKGPLVAHSTAQMTLDVIGDVLILAIPICVIWKIKIEWTQKIVLAGSLCLTIFMIVVTIIRVSGLVHDGVVNNIWEIYWNMISAQVGLFMASAIAFRTFFVTRSNSKAQLSPKEQVRKFFKESYLNKKFNKKRSDWSDTFDEINTDDGGLPRIPRAQLTGMRTFIDGNGKSFNGTVNANTTFSDTASTLSHSSDDAPLKKHSSEQMV